MSPGCEQCYAETFAHRLGLKVWGPTNDRKFFGDKHWREPFRWAKKAAKDGVRRRVFCASMCDVFEDRPDLVDPRFRLGETIWNTPALDWLLLTKRPENMVPMGRLIWPNGWPPNVWAGCTVEDQRRADERIPELAQVPAAVRFVSYEPALGLVDFDRHLMICKHWKTADSLPYAPWCPPWPKFEWKPQALVGAGWRRPFDWLIAGGESGHGARPFDLSWARNVVAQCKAAGVACFFKQAGAHPIDNGKRLALRDRKGGDLSELDEGLRIREFPKWPA